MTEVNKNTASASDRRFNIFCGVALVFLMGTIFFVNGKQALNIYASEDRAEQIEYAKSNYSFLKGPSETFNDRFDDRKRRVVFLNEKNYPITRMESANLENQNLAILYAAKVEAKVGRQEWLNKAYQSYAFTEEEFERLKGLEKAYDEKQRYQALKSVRPLEAQGEKRVTTAENEKEVLNERGLLAQM